MSRVTVLRLREQGCPGGDVLTWAPPAPEKQTRPDPLVWFLGLQEDQLEYSSRMLLESLLGQRKAETSLLFPYNLA